MTPDLPIAFYLPYRRDGIDSVPTSADDYWPWLLAHRSISKGKYSWTLQTFLRLRKAGFDCRLAENFPDCGIVVSHRDFLPVFLRPRPSVFLICIKPDRKLHPWAQFHIVQNANDRILRAKEGPTRSATIAYWPQPGLLSRDVMRGTTCKNIAYFGRGLNLAPELRTEDWAAALRRLEFNWSIAEFERWNDYRNTDLTVSIRSFSRAKAIDNPIFDPDSKPPSKLVNSWLAGVPAIVGVESAYQSIRKSDLDFLAVDSPVALTEAIIRMRQDKDLYLGMVANGHNRARDFAEEAICYQWKQIFVADISDCLSSWREQSQLTRVCTSIRDICRYFSNRQNLKDLLAILR